MTSSRRDNRVPEQVEARVAQRVPEQVEARVAQRAPEQLFTCDSCDSRSCTREEGGRGPGNCPAGQEELMSAALGQYKSEELNAFYRCSVQVAAAGKGRWPRLRETAEFARRMGYRQLGVAFCGGLREEGRFVCAYLRRQGFTVVSVMCKTGGVSKEQAGIGDEEKAGPENFKPMCNPIAQAMLLNEAATEFNVMVGLCVGHDALFLKYAQALTTVLIAKDRALANNPVEAIRRGESCLGDVRE